MFSLSVDTTSESYATGQSFGALLVTAGAMALVWRLTAAWRRAESTEASGVSGASRAGRRRNVVLGVLALIAAGGFAKAITVYDPEPRAAETGRRTVDDGTPAWAAEDRPAPPRTVAAPAKVGDYRLMEVADPEPAKSGKRWFYGKDRGGVADVVLYANTVGWDPGLAEEKRRKSITQEFRDFFAGAKALQPSAFEPGPLGGRLSCAHLDRHGTEPALCAWSDATTFGAVLVREPTSLTAAADTARAFRAAAVRP
ncbi:hypothetical protein AB0J57_15740 [Streptomyces sp. NPDC049837]|uniref:hypothetical protein n=1 Tax=Streptomyces sp. NPDC049837 TaxID=3155277 RepID=UPI00341A802D